MAKMAVKVRLKPMIEQEKKLWQSVGTARWVYNWALHRQEENYRNGGKFITHGDLRKELTVLKRQDEYKWLSQVSNNVAKQAVKDLCGAFLISWQINYATKVVNVQSHLFTMTQKS